jgi:hypothetical protein
MTSLHGGDSATPKPDHYAGKKVWGVYVAGATFHIWTKAEVRQLASYGVTGVLPIVVPTQREKWWELNAGYAVLEKLCREAIAWGIPKGSPLCLDVEEHQAAQMPPTPDVSRAWAVACNTHGLIPWCYSTHNFHDPYCNRWLAQWPFDTPVNPQVPEGFRGWQYAGNVDGIDLNVFRSNEIFLSPELRPVKLSSDGAVISEAPTPHLEEASSPVSAPGDTDTKAVSDIAHSSSPGADSPGAEASSPVSAPGDTDTKAVSDIAHSSSPGALTLQDLVNSYAQALDDVQSVLKELEVKVAQPDLQGVAVDHLASSVPGSGSDSPPKETPMSASTAPVINLAAAWNSLRTAVVPLAGYIGAITALAGTDHIGATLRAVQAAISGLVIAIDHHNLTK